MPSRVPNDPNISREMRRFLEELAAVPRNNFLATAAPLVTDDAHLNYTVGSRWLDVTGGDEYVLVDATTGAAVWKKTTP